MILSQGQKVNVITRAIIIYKGHLLVTKWQDDFSFLIGGRVDFGEPLEHSIIREIYEETRMKAVINKLLYFNEHIFNFKGEQYHELGWYYLVDIDELTIDIGEIMENPDSSKLSIMFIPINQLDKYKLYPEFLVKYLSKDYNNKFQDSPRHIFSNELASPRIIKEMKKTY